LSNAFDPGYQTAAAPLNLASWVRYYLAVLGRYFPDHGGLEEFGNESRKLIADANRFLSATLKNLLLKYESCDEHLLNHDPEAESFALCVQNAQKNYEDRFNQLIQRIEASV
jgi:hypothetical protein